MQARAHRHWASSTELMCAASVQLNNAKNYEKHNVGRGFFWHIRKDVGRGVAVTVVTA
jgi:hypothetical protein